MAPFLWPQATVPSLVKAKLGLYERQLELAAGQALGVMEQADTVAKFAGLGSMASKEVYTRSLLQGLPSGGWYPNPLTGQSSPFDYGGLQNFATGPGGMHADVVPEFNLSTVPRVDPAYDLAVGMPPTLPTTWSKVEGLMCLEMLRRRRVLIKSFL
jgi:hypothetical protein